MLCEVSVCILFKQEAFFMINNEYGPDSHLLGNFEALGIVVTVMDYAMCVILYFHLTLRFYFGSNGAALDEHWNSHERVDGHTRLMRLSRARVIDLSPSSPPFPAVFCVLYLSYLLLFLRACV